MYRILYSTGNGVQQGPRFRHYKDALRYIDEHSGEASFAIKKPDGAIVNMSQRVPPKRGASARAKVSQVDRDLGGCPTRSW